MAIKFEDKKSGGKAAAPARKPADAAPPEPVAERPKPPVEASPSALPSPAEAPPELPFGKPVRPEKKSRRK